MTQTMPKVDKIAKNGYAYTVLGPGRRELTHRLIAEQKLGRPLKEGERAYFKDNDRTNLDPANIEVRSSGKKASLKARLAKIEAKIADLEAEADDLRSQIG